MSGVILGYFSIENINITYVKQAFPHFIPSPCDHRSGTKKSSKTAPKIIPKPFLESTNKHNKHNKHKQTQTSIIKTKNTAFRSFLLRFRAKRGSLFGSKMVPKGFKIDLKSVFANLVNFARRAGHSSVLQGRRCENWSQNRPKVIPRFDFEVFGSVSTLKS